MIDAGYGKVFEYFHYRGVMQFAFYDDLIAIAEEHVPTFKTFYVLVPNKRLADGMLSRTVEVLQNDKHIAISRVNRLDRVIFLESGARIKVVNYENPQSVMGLVGHPEESAFYIVPPA